MLKENLLAYFEQYKGQVRSGEELAEQFQVSRTAIWKAINRLREEGYAIIAIKKKGYMLENNSDIISEIKIKQNIIEDYDRIEVHKTIDSTTKRAKELILSETINWGVVISEEQLNGKGRNNKHYPSPKGKGIYMSIIMQPKLKVEALERFKYALNQAIQQAVLDYIGIQIERRDATDLVYKGKKIGGMLTESIFELETGIIKTVIVGIGLNIYGTSKDFNGDQQLESSISKITGNYCNRSEIISCILNNVKKIDK